MTEDAIKRAVREAEAFITAAKVALKDLCPGKDSGALRCLVGMMGVKKMAFGCCLDSDAQPRQHAGDLNA